MFHANAILLSELLLGQCDVQDAYLALNLLSMRTFNFMGAQGAADYFEPLSSHAHTALCDDETSF
jgi:hypothetical protein